MHYTTRTDNYVCMSHSLLTTFLLGFLCKTSVSCRSLRPPCHAAPWRWGSPASHQVHFFFSWLCMEGNKTLSILLIQTFAIFLLELQRHSRMNKTRHMLVYHLPRKALKPPTLFTLELILKSVFFFFFGGCFHGCSENIFLFFFLGGGPRPHPPKKTKLTLITQSFWEFWHMLPYVFPESGIFNFLICPV